jgi:hypothetical protein
MSFKDSIPVIISLMSSYQNSIFELNIKFEKKGVLIMDIGSLTAIINAIFDAAQQAYNFIMANIFLAVPFATGSVYAVTTIIKKFSHA